MKNYKCTIDSLICNIENGKELYYKNALFHNSMNYLLRGTNEVVIIAYLCRIIDEQNNKINDLVSKEKPFYIIK
jgi:hypothetical protein